MRMLQNKNFHMLLLIVLVLVLIVSLIPLFIIAKYNYAGGDDLIYGAGVSKAIEDGASVGEVFKTATRFVEKMYNEWQGTYSALFLFAFHPGVFSHEAYNLTPIIFIITFILCTAFLSYTLMVKLLKTNIQSWIIITSFLCLLSIQLSVSVREGFFWYNSAVYYTFYHSMFLILISLIIYIFICKKQTTKTIFMVISVLLTAFIAGGNYATNLVCGEFLCFALLYSVIIKDKKVMLYIVFMLIVFAVGMYISVSAQGNAIRQASAIEAGYKSCGLCKTIGMAFVFAVYFGLEWLDLACVGLMFLCVLFVGPRLKQIDFKFKNPLLFVALTFCIFASQFAPSAYAASSPGPVRLRNVAYYIFLLLLIVDTIYVTGWVMKKKDVNTENKKDVNKIQLILKYPLIVMLIIAICIGSTAVQRGVYDIPAVEATIELKDGTAYKHGARRLNKLKGEPMVFPCAKMSDILS